MDLNSWSILYYDYLSKVGYCMDFIIKDPLIHTEKGSYSPRIPGSSDFLSD